MNIGNLFKSINIGNVATLAGMFFNNGKNSPGTVNTILGIGLGAQLIQSIFTKNDQSGMQSQNPSLFSYQAQNPYASQNAAITQQAANYAFVTGKQKIETDLKSLQLQLQSQYLNEKNNIMNDFQQGKIDRNTYEEKLKALDTSAKQKNDELSAKAQQMISLLQQRVSMYGGQNMYGMPGMYGVQSQMPGQFGGGYPSTGLNFTGMG